MNYILLSGGSGRRLWPLSNDVRSRQFIKILKRPDGSYESMMQRTCRQIRHADGEARITVAASKVQASAIHNQLRDRVDICIERSRKGTFPVIALAAAYLRDRKGVPENETVVVCPVDTYAEENYYAAVRRMAELSAEGQARLIVLGITPTGNSENYGYILPEEEASVSRVGLFREKPDRRQAKRYLEKGALWNGGVYAFQLKYVLEKARERLGFSDFEELYDRYDSLENISFDYAVAEKETDIRVLRYDGKWKDISTWDMLCAEMTEPVIGQALCDDGCRDLSVVNELNVPILCMGLKDVVVSASAEGILVSDKRRSRMIEPYVGRMEQRVMFAEKSWGDFRVLDVGDGSMTVKAVVRPGYQMNYHSHDHRDEVWIVLSGTGRTIVDGMEEHVKAGDVITMEAGCRHTIIAESELQLIEVQLGKGIDAHDKRKYGPEG